MSIRSSALRRVAAIGAGIVLRSGTRKEPEGDFKGDSIHLVSPASHGSLGDEALIHGSVNINERHGYRNLLIASGDLADWGAVGTRGLSADDAERWGGLKWDLPSQDLSHKLVVIGADSIDGVYGLRSVTARIGLLNAHAERGGDAHLANFSLKKAPPSDAMKLLRLLRPEVKLSARDALSQARAEKFLEREVSMSPDVAQHLVPEATPRVIRFAEKVAERRGGRPVVVLVPNAHYGALYGDAEKIGNAFRLLLKSLVDRGFFTVLLAHDLRASPGDPALLAHMAEGVPPSQTMSFLPTSAMEAKAVVALADGVITGRMHAAVAALSQDIPVLGLDYVDKFIGQFDWYGAGSNVVGWEELFSAEQVTSAFEEALRTNPATARTVALKLPAWLR